MIEEDIIFIDTMLDLGLTSYEAHVYYALFQLKYATVHDIHSACTVPRNKIYETLSSLEEKGFVAVIDRNPLQYARIDIEQTFTTLRRKEMGKLNRIEEFLKSQETKPLFDLEAVSPHAYELHSEMAIENHLKAIIRNTHKELFIGVLDADFFNKLFTKQDLKKLGKRVNLYIVVKDATLKDKIDYPCYMLQEEELRKSMEGFEDPGLKLRNIPQNGKIALMSDRRNLLNIDIVDNKPIASVMLTRHPFVVAVLNSDQKKFLIPLK